MLACRKDTEQEGNYEPYEPAIDAMIKAIFLGTIHWPKQFIQRGESQSQRPSTS